MNFSKILTTILSVSGIVVMVGWALSDIVHLGKLSPIFAVFGICAIILANVIEINSKLEKDMKL